jgi:Tol biopolymer transport system component
MIPKQLGSYEIIEKIGAGGMGEVYRARDSRLGRDVALKLLPTAFADDPERLGRSEREARLLASLNHPHIGAIYGLEQAEGRRFLVLELVPGVDLSVRLASGPLPLDEALSIARDIAEALEYAHEQGIVHRDLKPANIKLTPEGRVKVLDFGLAKALDSEDPMDPRLSQSPTVLATPATMAGVILGTAAYMSPEQARGKSVDKRSDVFAFGCVLYEMLTGMQAFTGDTVSDTLAAILKSDVQASAFPESTPRAIRELLKRCLEKDVKLRLRDIGEARIAIDSVLEAGPQVEPPAVAASATQGTPRLRIHLIWGVSAVAIAAATFLASRALTPAAGDLPFRKFAIQLDEAEPSQSEFRVALSSDGQRIAYVLNNRLWVRELSKLEAIEIPGTAGAENPFWSPDGQQIGYRIGSTFYRVGAAGGSSTAISATRETFTGGSGALWTDNDRIVFTTGSKGLVEVPALGGDPVEFLKKEADEIDLHEPGMLPGGRGFVFVSHNREKGPSSLVVYAGGQRKTLLTLEGQRISTPKYSPTGHILFQRRPTNAGIWALPFSLSSLEATGEPFLVGPEGVEPCPGPHGLLVYRTHADLARAQFAWIGRDGRLQSAISDVYEVVGHPAISPDGTRFAATVVEGNSNGDIWVFDLARGTRQRLSFDPSWEIEPAWSADGETVYFVAASLGSIRERRADGTGDIHSVTRGWAPCVSRDGKWMSFDDEDAATGSSNIFKVPLPVDSTVAPVTLVGTKAQEEAPRISPSGEYVAYESDESGRGEIYLTRFPNGEGKWQVSVEGGSRPRWDPAGGRLYFTSDTAMMEVEVVERPNLQLGNPRRLFEFKAAHVTLGHTSSYDVARGGQRFLMSYVAESATQSPTFELVVVEDWPAEFKKPTQK